MSNNSYTMPVLLDSNTSVAIEYNVGFTPTTFFINQNGEVIDTKLGPFSSQSEVKFTLKKLG